MNKIILYTIHCSKCNVVQKKLEQKGIQFETVTDLESVKAIGLKAGITSAPILQVGDNFFDFSKAVKWIGEQ